MKQIAIYGAGGFGREMAWLAEACGGAFEVVCFADDDLSMAGRKLNGIPVVNFESLKEKFPSIGVVPAIGSPIVRQKVVEKLEKAGFSSQQLIHPRTEMSRWIEIGEGSVICAGCILTTNIRLGKHVQINLDCTVGHDVVMGDYTTLAPGVHVSGWVHFGKRVYVGTGAVFVNGTEEKPLVIGDDVVVGAGACVTKSVDCGVWGGCLQSPLGSEAQDIGEGDKGSLDRFAQWRFPEIEEGRPTKYNWMVQHKEHLDLGYKTDIGAFTYINAKHGVTIEDYVQVGSHCAIYSVSTIDDKSGPVKLKKNARIGSHSTIMPGVTIGENAVVGAHSFVNRDVTAGKVVAGVPAEEVRSRRL